MKQHRWLLPWILVAVTVKVKVIVRRRQERDRLHAGRCSPWSV